jgi:flagellar hook-associated protein 2
MYSRAPRSDPLDGEGHYGIPCIKNTEEPLGRFDDVLQRRGDLRFHVAARVEDSPPPVPLGVSVPELQGAGSTVLQAGGDAQLTMDGLAISRASNVIDDLLPGVSLQLSDLGATTIRIDQDLEGATKKVRALVDAMNGLLTELGRQGATSADAAGRGPLSGDPLVRTLATQIRGSISQVVAQDGPLRTLSDLGVSLTRDGRITLDEAKLSSALTTDPAAAGRILGRAGSASDARVGVTAAGRAAAGEYQLEVTRAPRIAAVTGASFSPPGAVSPKVFTVTGPDGTAVSIEIGESVDCVLYK